MTFDQLKKEFAWASAACREQALATTFSHSGPRDDVSELYLAVTRGRRSESLLLWSVEGRKASERDVRQFCKATKEME